MSLENQFYGALARHEAKKRGGARKGAGRKPTGSTQVALSVKLDKEILQRFRAAVPNGKRSSFVAQAICAALDSKP